MKHRRKKMRKHKIFDSHEGWIDVTCPLTEKTYRHVIRCPNVMYVLCRGCGEKV